MKYSQHEAVHFQEPHSPGSNNKAIEFIPWVFKVSFFPKQSHGDPFYQHFQKKENIDNRFHCLEDFTLLGHTVYVKRVVHSQYDTVYQYYQNTGTFKPTKQCQG